MNILLIHGNGIVPTAGGISRTTANLGTLLRKYGHIVWFLGAKDIHPQAFYEKQQLFLPTEPISTEENRRFLLEIIKQNNISIIINQSPFNLALVTLLYRIKRETGAKVVSCYHNSILTPVIRYAYCHEYPLRMHGHAWLFHLLKWKPVATILVKGYIAKWRKAFRQTVMHSDAVVLLCEGQVDELLRMCGNKEESKAYVIPNCMPSSVSGREIKKKQVLWVGTFDRIVKRPDLMLQIWHKVTSTHPDWTLFMLGDGPSLKEMKDKAANLNLDNVVFTGRVNPTKYYEESGIQCMTSVHEAFPMVPLEAMAHGNPVIAFNSFTSAPMIIESGKTGCLVPPFDINVYADKLKNLVLLDLV